MTKLEKVISGLKNCQRNSCNSCPYANDDGESPYRTCRQIEMFGDALELLKEQEKELKNTGTLYQKIKTHWNRRRQQADATDTELKFLVEMLDWLEEDEPPKEGDGE